MIVDSAIYREGSRIEAPETLAELNAARRGGVGIAWIGLYRPPEHEFNDIAREFGLHDLAVEDAVQAHQRPKLERYGDTLFLVLRSARYLDDAETVEFGEVHIFAGPEFVITVRHAEAPDLQGIRSDLEARPELLARGTTAILHAILDRVVDDYAPVVAGIRHDIDEIEDDVFAGSPTVSRRIYELSREVIAFQRAVKPLPPIVNHLLDVHDAGEEQTRCLRHTLDHVVQVEEQVDSFRELLHNILSVNLTQETKALSEVSNAQNEQVKKISAWAAILFAPTVVGTVYGMNFEHMPGLHWQYGYPMALALMAAISIGLYLMFKHRNWI
jgi:magnesium transporter